MARVGELDSPGPSDIVADTDAAFAEYAIIIIANPERAVLTDRELLCPLLPGIVTVIGSVALHHPDAERLIHLFATLAGLLAGMDADTTQ